MALIKCPECHKKISDTCISCPHCGYVLKESDRCQSNNGYKEKKSINIDLTEIFNKIKSLEWLNVISDTIEDIPIIGPVLKVILWFVSGILVLSAISIVPIILIGWIISSFAPQVALLFIGLIGDLGFYIIYNRRGTHLPFLIGSGVLTFFALMAVIFLGTH